MVPLSMDGNERPLVSVIVVNWNGAAYLGACLDSVLAQTYPDLEIIVVDNGSTDASLALLRTYGSRLRVIENPTNLGFAGGNNVGLRAAKGAYVALLNSDAVADRDWVAALVRAAEADPGIGMCASKIYLGGHDRLLDSAGLLLSRDGIGRGRGRLEPDGLVFSREEDVFAPSACAALYRRSMLETIGLFDEDFFAYCEDSDLALRGRLAGWRCRYVPGALVVHAYSRSTAPYSAFKAFHVERNRIWVVVKCFPARLIVASLAFTIGRYAVQAYGALAGRGSAGRLLERTSSWTLLGIVARAWGAALARLPRMLRKRRAVHALRRVPAGEISSWFDHDRLGLAELALKD